MADLSAIYGGKGSKTMEFTIFSKNRTSADGRKFKTYLTRLTNNKTGETITASVKFREEAGEPEKCPCNIVVEKGDANLVSREYQLEDGTVGIGYTMWVSTWTEGTEYVDHSMDDYI